MTSGSEGPQLQPAVSITAAAPAQPKALIPRITAGKAALALALLLGLQPVTTDLFLPALPALTKALAAPMSQAQLTMSALILAFGLAQLVWGPAADRFGRKPVLVLGLLLHCAASLASALAGSIESLIVWRVLQGAALAAVVVCARALLRDLYEPVQGARVMSMGLSGLGLIAIIGPLLGGLVAGAWGWRMALATVAAFSALSLAFVVWQLPETLLQRNPAATQLGPLLRRWGQIGRHRSFVAWTLLISCSYGALFTILAGSSFIFMDVLGLTPGWYGLSMALASASYLLGTFFCRHWLQKYGIKGAVARGAGFTLLGGLGTLVLALIGGHSGAQSGWQSGWQSVWAVLLPQCLFAFGHRIHQPCGQAGAVGPFPHSAGAASALAGFILSLVAFGIGLWLGQFLDGGLLPYALSLCFWATCTSLVAWTLVQWQTDPNDAVR